MSGVAAQPGSYVLHLELAATACLSIGKLGRFGFAPGWYCYIGSAFGPGGLHARLKHHAGRADSPHWHIDYFRRAARLAGFWYSYDVSRHEHAWACALHRLSAVRVPAARFGASDCACPAHLLYLGRRRSASKITNALQAVSKHIEYLEWPRQAIPGRAR